MMDALLKKLAAIPGALMIIPLMLGAVVNSLFPEILAMGGFTSALFKSGLAALIGLFFVCIGSQIHIRAAVTSVEKGLVLLLAKYLIAVAIGLAVAFLMPEGTLFGILPLAIIAAMSNSNGSLYAALTSEFGNATDRGAISVLSLNDGPFLTMVALGAAGLAQFPLLALFAAIFPIILGFVLGNISATIRAFLQPGEKLIIPFAAFAIGANIHLAVLFGSGAVGVILGALTLICSGGAAVAALYAWHRIRRHPKPARNVISAAAEATVAGNAIATPAAVAMVDPALVPIQEAATAQIAAAVVVTAFVCPFLVSFVHRWQRKRGISPEAETDYYKKS
ncbi:MAG: 2-keto-3-deoxygluconate permease [Neisseria sp.]|nr:2-keto-3-deoxygluconate permease [Neisseria sp.]